MSTYAINEGESSGNWEITGGTGKYAYISGQGTDTPTDYPGAVQCQTGKEKLLSENNTQQLTSELVTQMEQESVISPLVNLA
jgi:hypothetical protein